MDDAAAVRSVRKPRGQGASRQGEILAAAKRLFLTEGFERTTVRKIAAAVGVSAAALYLYFPDKEAILRAIAESTFESLLACLEQTQAQPGSELDRLRAGLAGYIAFGLAHPDEYRLTFLAKMMASSGPGRPCAGYPAPAAAEHSFGILASLIGHLMRAGVFAAADPVLTAEAVWASVHGTTALLLDQAAHVKSDPAALIGMTLDIIIKGLCVTT
nr:TetR/AcrR family transcriptional regulator [uncultured Rhodopila sp.]